MNFIYKVFALFNVLSVLSVLMASAEDMYANEEETNQIDSLCDRPYINAADRMTNNTVRVYRGQHYWTLNGLPARSATVDGPYALPFENIGSIYRNNTVVTLLGGTDRGKTVKTESKTYWVWDDTGKMKSNSTGILHNRFPLGGFEATLHDGNSDDPTLIGFKGIKVYYYSTRYKVWSIDSQPSGWVGGRDNEKFPTDLTAAFSYPANDPKDGYIAYLFKRDKYCKRTKTLKSGKECDEWLPNKVLFGCEGQDRVVKGENGGQGTDGNGGQGTGGNGGQGTGGNGTQDNETSKKKNKGTVITSNVSFLTIIVSVLLAVHYII